MNYSLFHSLVDSIKGNPPRLHRSTHGGPTRHPHQHEKSRHFSSVSTDYQSDFEFPFHHRRASESSFHHSQHVSLWLIGVHVGLGRAYHIKAGQPRLAGQLQLHTKRLEMESTGSLEGFSYNPRGQQQSFLLSTRTPSTTQLPLL